MRVRAHVVNPRDSWTVMLDREAGWGLPRRVAGWWAGCSLAGDGASRCCDSWSGHRGWSSWPGGSGPRTTATGLAGRADLHAHGWQVIDFLVD